MQKSTTISAPCRAAMVSAIAAVWALVMVSKRAFVQLVVPDQLVVRAGGKGALGQDDQLQQRLPHPAGIIDHPLVRQELVQIAPHRPVVIVVRRAEVGQQHPDLRLADRGMGAGGMGQADPHPGSRCTPTASEGLASSMVRLSDLSIAGTYRLWRSGQPPLGKGSSGTPSASASLCRALPGRKGFCWLSCGAQPVRNTRSKVATSRSSGVAKLAR